MPYHFHSISINMEADPSVCLNSDLCVGPDDTGGINKMSEYTGSPLQTVYPSKNEYINNAGQSRKIVSMDSSLSYVMQWFKTMTTR